MQRPRSHPSAPGLAPRGFSIQEARSLPWIGVLFLVAIALYADPLAAQATLTDEEVRTAMDAAEVESRANGWNLTIIIADADGVPLALRRFGGATHRSYEIATGKISTVLETGMTTGAYAAALADGTLEPIEGGITFEGGYPILRDGQIIGAISASGARGSEDAQVVRVGLAAIGLQP